MHFSRGRNIDAAHDADQAALAAAAGADQRDAIVGLDDQIDLPERNHGALIEYAVDALQSDQGWAGRWGGHRLFDGPRRYFFMKAISASALPLLLSRTRAYSCRALNTALRPLDTTSTAREPRTRHTTTRPPSPSPPNRVLTSLSPPAASRTPASVTFSALFSRVTRRHSPTILSWNAAW